MPQTTREIVCLIAVALWLSLGVHWALPFPLSMFVGAAIGWVIGWNWRKKIWPGIERLFTR